MESKDTVEQIAEILHEPVTCEDGRTHYIDESNRRYLSSNIHELELSTLASGAPELTEEELKCPCGGSVKDISGGTYQCEICGSWVVPTEETKIKKAVLHYNAIIAQRDAEIARLQSAVEALGHSKPIYKMTSLEVRKQTAEEIFKEIESHKQPDGEWILAEWVQIGENVRTPNGVVTEKTIPLAWYKELKARYGQEV